MRLARNVVVVLVLGSLAASPAWAGKDKKKKGKDDEGILLTGIEAFDDVFVRVGEIDARLASAEGQLRSAKKNLNTALELKKGTPLADGIAELSARAQGQVTVALTEQAVPKLQVSDAVPSNVQSAVDAVNTLTSNLTTSIADLQALGPEIDGLVKATRTMPTKLKDEFSDSAGLIEKLFELPKTTKALNRDISITTGLPERTTSLTGRMTDILGIVNTEFVPAGIGGGKNAGNAGGKPGGSRTVTGEKKRPPGK